MWNSVYDFESEFNSVDTTYWTQVAGVIVYDQGAEAQAGGGYFCKRLKYVALWSNRLSSPLNALLQAVDMDRWPPQPTTSPGLSNALISRSNGHGYTRAPQHNLYQVDRLRHHHDRGNCGRPSMNNKYHKRWDGPQNSSGQSTQHYKRCIEDISGSGSSHNFRKRSRRIE